MKIKPSDFSTLPCLVFAVMASLSWPAARADVLWDGDASKGIKVFGDLNAVNGTVTVENDPTYGPVFKMLCHDNGNTKARSEASHMRGFQPSNTGTYYFGWRQKWGPLPTKIGKWQVVEQIHLAGKGAPGGPVPFGLAVPGDGNMYVNAQDPNGKVTVIWKHALPINEWHSFVYHMKFGETVDQGWMEIWYDGVQQTLQNGQTRMPCAMAHADSTSYWKWGIYRSGSGGPIGDSVAYLWRPRAGTTYEDVAPPADAGQ